MSDKVKILVIDDSITYRQIMVAVIEKISDAECIGTAASGQIALRKISLMQPDLVLLDAVMPEMDGVETLQEIKQRHPAIEAIMISSFEMNNAKETLRSLQIGALDFVAKPKVSKPEDGIAELVKYLQPLVHLVQTKKYATFSRRDYTNKPASTKEAPVILPATPVIKTETPRITSQRLIKSRFDLCVIGVSTGGPKALDELIPRLNPAMPCPIIIVQHMPPMFTESLAMKLNDGTSLQVSEAKGGEELTARHVYIAPGGKHLVLRKRMEGRYCLALNETPPVNNCRPSVDVLFRSVAATFQGNVLAVVMTGMGRDGTEGVRMLKRNGNKCIVQDQHSSIVWGMPGSVYEAGLADEVVSLAQLGNRINQLIL
jgi:two-component system chemotaxis response regulator CheB